MKIYRIRVQVAQAEPRIFKIKSNSYQEAKAKLLQSITFEEMLSDEEAKTVNSFFDDIINLTKSKP